jgi:hypothetical protein
LHFLSSLRILPSLLLLPLLCLIPSLRFRVVPRCHRVRLITLSCPFFLLRLLADLKPSHEILQRWRAAPPSLAVACAAFIDL